MTLLEQLQRGLGSGFRAVLDGADAAEHLYACVAADPRWDSQLDSRSDYYARLLLYVEADVSVVEQIVRERDPQYPDDRTGPSFALQVLDRMAGLDSAAAIEAIRRYVADGNHWYTALDALVEDEWSGEPRADWRDHVDGLAEVICARFPTGAELRELFGWAWTDSATSPPWSEWRLTHPLIREALTATPAPPPPETWPSVSDLTTGELLAAKGSSRWWRVAGELAKRTEPDDVAQMLRVLEQPTPMFAAALQALGAQQRVEVLPTIVARVDQHRRGATRRALHRAFVALPYDATRPIAREWLASDDENRRRLGADVMADHCLPDDIALVRNELTRDVAAGRSGNQYAICSLAEALERQPGHGPYEELDRAFREMPYSYGRRFVAQALAATDPEFPHGLAIDCLWDAEPDTRAVGMRHAARSVPAAARRIDEIRTDMTEAPMVRDAR